MRPIIQEVGAAAAFFVAFLATAFLATAFFATAFFATAFFLATCMYSFQEFVV